MLSEPDRQIAARDWRIPGLDLLFDDAALLERLRSVSAPSDIVDVHVDYLRYKPGTSCLGRLRIHTGHGESLAYAKAYRADAELKLVKSERFCNEAGRPQDFHRDKALVMHRFPSDRLLPALRRFDDSSALPSALRRLNADLARVRGVTLEPLQYKPERRFVGKILRNECPIAALKLYSRRGYELARRAAKSFNRAQDCNSPRCIGHSDLHAALAFEWIDGTPLSAIHSGDERFRTAIRETGRTLYAIHRQTHYKLRSKSAEKIITILQENVRELCSIAPDMAGYATRLCQEIVRRLSTNLPSKLVPVHGDVHFKQILFAGDSIHLLDFDRACLSDPMEDLGRFYAGLIIALSQSTPVQSADDLLGELLQAYVDSGGNVDRGRIALFAACRLWEVVCEPFRYRHVDWPSDVERRLRLMEEVLNMHPSKGHTITQTHCDEHASFNEPIAIQVDPFRLAEDRALIPRSDLIDSTMARQLFTRLESADGRHAGLELQSIHVRRHKPGRRCVIEYYGNSITTGENIALLGKVDSKARHRRYFEQQCRLWDAGFDEQSRDRICVARPWGVVQEWNMWLQQKADGVDCWSALRVSQGCFVARRIAQALYKLHSSSIRTTRHHSLDHELETLDDRLHTAAVEAPKLAEKIGLLRQSYHDPGQELRAAADVPIHRDFYPDQVIVGQERLVLVDFDLLSSGNPALDVGNFRGHLIEHSLRTRGHPFLYAAQEEAFVREYCRLSSEVSPNVISFFTTITLARHVYLCLTIPGRRANAERVLDFASELLAKSKRACI